MLIYTIFRRFEFLQAFCRVRVTCMPSPASGSHGIMHTYMSMYSERDAVAC